MLNTIRYSIWMRPSLGHFVCRNVSMTHFSCIWKAWFLESSRAYVLARISTNLHFEMYHKCTCGPGWCHIVSVPKCNLYIPARDLVPFHCLHLLVLILFIVLYRAKLGHDQRLWRGRAVEMCLKIFVHFCDWQPRVTACFWNRRVYSGLELNNVIV